MDILFSNVTLLSMTENTIATPSAYVGIKDGKIHYTGTEKPAVNAARTIDGQGKLLMPGFVNAHTHVPMTLLRGYADDMNLQTWLFDHIFPAEDKLTAEMCRTGALLAIMEMLASGTVSFSDMYDFNEAIADAVMESGIKANLCRPLMHMGDAAYDRNTDTRLQQLDALRKKYHGKDNNRLRIDAGIHAEYTSPPTVWEAAADYAKTHNLGLHVHISETKTEHDECIARHGMTPTAVLAKHGAFDVPVTAAHCVHITPEDMVIFRDKKATAVHNPVSNLKLASGIAPVNAMLSAGMRVALGTDGMASNNSHDMLEEIKLCALLHRPNPDHPNQDYLGAGTALRIATAGGAAAQRRELETGKIASGFDADLILVDFDRPHLCPVHNPVSNLCYAAKGSDVALTMVRGRVLYENGAFTTIDREQVLAEAARLRDIF